MSNEIALIPSRTPTLAILGDGLDADEVESVLRLAENAKSVNTRLAYASDWRDFTSFMERRGEITLPASPGLICLYVVHSRDRGLKASSIGRRIAAISHYHRKAGFDPGPTSAPAVRECMKALRRELGTAPDKKMPVTADLLLRLLATCPDTTKGTRDKALLAVAFSAALRRSEVVGIDVEHLNWTTEGITLLIPRSKGDQEGRGQTIAIPTGIYIKPVQLIRNWLTVSGITSGPLFRPVNRGGLIAEQRLGDDAFVRMLKARTQAANIDPTDVSGHSLRRGFLSSAAAANASVWKMQAVSRHKSLDTLSGYVHEVDAYRDHAGSGFL